MSEHVEVLSQWWKDAEVPTRATLPKDGDRIIIRHNLEWYEIATSDGDAGEDELSADTRVLARAPKPKPAWHDAVAVMARCEGAPSHHREAFMRLEATPGYWKGEGGHAHSDDLRDVIPLVEARVTDEMVQRAVDEYEVRGSFFAGRYRIRGILAAALGVDE